MGAVMRYTDIECSEENCTSDTQIERALRTATDGFYGLRE